MRATLTQAKSSLAGALYMTNRRLMFDAAKGDARWLIIPFDEVKTAGVYPSPRGQIGAPQAGGRRCSSRRRTASTSGSTSTEANRTRGSWQSGSGWKRRSRPPRIKADGNCLSTALQLADAVAEAPDGEPQRLLCIEVALARVLHDREEQVAEVVERVWLERSVVRGSGWREAGLGGT